MFKDHIMSWEKGWRVGCGDRGARNGDNAAWGRKIKSVTKGTWCVRCVPKAVLGSAEWAPTTWPTPPAAVLFLPVCVPVFVLDGIY